MTNPDPNLAAVTSAVLQKSKYEHIQPGLVEQLAARELVKGRKPKEAIKEVSAKLHQIGAAYFKLAPQYAHWLDELASLPNDPLSEDVRTFALQVMQAHSSTAERLPILAEFYADILAPLGPLESVFDLACGLNPLALPWMPLQAGARYFGCDIFSDLIAFDNAFLRHCGLDAHLETADIFHFEFKQPVQAALLLKSLPCLEQLEKGAAGALVDAVPAQFLLVSYPIRSLGGRSKGMRQTYNAQFKALTANKKWKITQYEFSSELAFLVEK
ncbi:class I SAM-dependent methyltransferase [Pelolinea submarina]|uniref:16S rRNA (guanine(1405)-N(7))-methyltransferase n=1 Tax=Pelolinea submarina TaxID=913107 RepID=A0A347ZVQ2_9CHLR|nr:16S rRNA methyltransferase [Pelolinea submarina]REG07079.1 16S rRNA (guanine(1405)-N(7))-methyltransferase [Pelolinea submarina]BBB49383.1 16S rRNA (guanine(1405)-N(7))-methyltransferase [Pelolinea submarina]